MARKNIALLALDEEAVVVPEVEGEEAAVQVEDVQQLEQVTAEVEADKEVIEEAQDTSEAIGEIADKVEAKEEGIDEDTAEVVKVAVEHFCARLGYSSKKVSVAVESFGEATRKEKSVQLAKELRIAQESIDKQICIAQEGLWDKIKTKFDQVFTTYNKLGDQLVLSAKKYDEKGAISEPVSAKQISVYLNPENKDEVTGKDVVAQLTVLAKLVGEDSLVKLVQEAAKLTNDMIGNVASSTFVAKDEEIAKIKEANERITKLLADFNEAVTGTGKKASSEVKMQPLEAADKAKLVKLCDALVAGNKLKGAQDELTKKYNALWAIVFNGKQIRLAGAWASDIKAAKLAVTQIGELSNKIAKILADSFKVTLAAVRYMEQSTAK